MTIGARFPNRRRVLLKIKREEKAMKARPFTIAVMKRGQKKPTCTLTMTEKSLSGAIRRAGRITRRDRELFFVPIRPLGQRLAF